MAPRRRFVIRSFLRLLPALVAAMHLAAAADDVQPRWPQFHGPGGAGIAQGKQDAPVEFGPENGLLWKTPLPVGHSSPTIWGERIFLTGFQPEEKRLETLCLDRASGRIVWRRPVPTKTIEPVHDISNPAASTPVTDGKAVFVYFGSYGLVAYDFEGRERWSKALPMAKTFMNQGSGTSPILVGDRLLLDVLLEKESYLLAVRTENGETVWKASKPEFNGGWTTPVTWREGEETLVGVLNPSRFTAHSLRDGSERWWIKDLPWQTCSTPAVGDGVLFLSASGVQGESDNVTLPPTFDEMIARYDQNKNGRVEVDEIPETLLVTDRRAGKGAGDMSLRGLLGFFAQGGTPPTSYDRAQWDAIIKGSTEFMQGPLMQSGVLAVRVGGKGDVTKSHVAWTESRGVPEVPSPLLYKDRLYLVKNGGIVLSREAATGKTVFQGRLGAPGGYYASPIAAGGRIYVASDQGTVVVFEAKDTLQVLARNTLPEPIMATPAIVDGKLYVRTLSHLYAFGSGKKSSPR
jgi:outer membrane protein assembly factor BamB